MNGLLIVTDLDGTLLDHDTYSFAAAAPALAALHQRRIPLVLASSKTRAEMQLVQRRLGIDHPFICENGAAICTPSPDGLSVEALAAGRGQVLEVLAELRQRSGFRFTGFSDCSVERIAELTGLDVADAALAAQREFTEPVRWEDDEHRLAEFRSALVERGLSAQQGGRFLSVSWPADKGRAVLRLRQCQADWPAARLVVLGDSPNDESMLAVADIAVIIRSSRSGTMEVTGPERIIRTAEPGPRGWQAALSALLAEFPAAAEKTDMT